ncbi:MAG: RIP metalloprotease RseP [bacterium]|nr:RIP metalloprotease RseP [bacterium]
MLTVILAFVICLGVLIFVHEFGHFIVAKAIGIKVEKFSLGFGPKIPWLGFKKGDTEYMISALPLGGYVKMAGENPDEELKGEPWEFSSRSPWERMQVVFSGPLMNVILAVLLMFTVFLIGRKIPAYLMTSPVIGWVRENSPAHKAGFQVGDRVISINDRKIDHWEALQMIIVSNAGSKLRILVERRGQHLALSVTPHEVGDMGLGSIGIDHYIPPRIGSVNAGYPAQKAGLQAGDLITHINGKAVGHWYEIAELIHDHPGKRVVLNIRRKDREFSVTVVPMADPETKQGLIGIMPSEEMIIKKYGLLASIQNGLAETLRQAKLTFSFIFKLIRGKTSPKSLGGPIMIAQVAGASAKAGIPDFIYFMAFLSLQLGILNLFPIPILDGGHIFFLIIEMIVGKPLSIRKREVAQQIGFGMLILLMVYVFYNDIMRFFVH